MNSLMFYLMMALLVAVSLFMTLMVLVQKGRGGGFASMMGGASGHTAFGNKTDRVMTWATAVSFAVFIALAVALNLVIAH